MKKNIILRISNKTGIDTKLIIKLLKQEDKRFFKHNGLDYIRIIKSFLINTKYLKIKEGASTISQQIYDIKEQNKSLKYKRPRNIRRKIKQIFFAKKIEKILTKEELLIYYLENVFLGKNVFGFKNGSQFYFKKDSKKLNKFEIDFLLKRVKRPNDLKY